MGCPSASRGLKLPRRSICKHFKPTILLHDMFWRLLPPANRRYSSNSFIPSKRLPHFGQDHFTQAKVRYKTISDGISQGIQEWAAATLTPPTPHNRMMVQYARAHNFGLRCICSSKRLQLSWSEFNNSTIIKNTRF